MRERPLYARIAGIVDTYDALISPRPWRAALSRHDALQVALDLHRVVLARQPEPLREPADVRVDEGTNVSDAYEQGDNRFTGRIHKVTVDVK